jgi:two-component system sensor kinase FixL
MHNADEAARYHKKSEEIRSREAEASNKMTIDGRSSDAAVISITEDGTIDAVNKTLCQMFGYTKSELVGRNIKSIVPSPWKGKHDLFLDRYITTGDAKVIGKAPRALFGQHKAGYAFALNLSIQERRKERGEKTFVALLVQTDLEKKEGVVIIKEDGTIILVSKVVTELFGYTPAEMLGTNVTIFMLDAYAANHESYLRRYKETGEARVIGTAGRNVPARKKDATVFPASLTVVEEYVGFEKFFLANIQDTTNLKATIYIDGMGTIQNVDIGITQLLGYRKDDVVGKNIKGIMPPPYNQCKFCF